MWQAQTSCFGMRLRGMKHLPKLWEVSAPLQTSLCHLLCEYIDSPAASHLQRPFLVLCYAAGDLPAGFQLIAVDVPFHMLLVRVP